MAEYRIDDLARVAGTSVRNVRVYQDRDLLPPPVHRGRTAVYGDAHLSRLRLILDMLGRGYAFAQIKEMLAAWESGHSLADVLGLEQATGSAWSQELPQVISMSELRRRFGKHLTPAVVARAIELDLIQRQGVRIVVPSMRLLEVGEEMVRFGVPLAEVLEVAASIQRDIDGLTETLIRLVRTYVLDPRGPGWLPSGEELPYYADVISRLHPLSMTALAAAVDRSARRMIPQVMGDRLIELADRAKPATAE